VLQCLFNNAPFRAGIYAAEPALLDASPPLRQLRCVSKRCCCVVSRFRFSPRVAFALRSLR
jgi:hypothetical protein